MDFRKAVLKRVAVWTVLGLVGGGFAADLLWRQKSAQEQTTLKSQQAEELPRLAAPVKPHTDQRAAARRRPEALERALSEGRK